MLLAKGTAREQGRIPVPYACLFVHTTNSCIVLIILGIRRYTASNEPISLPDMRAYRLSQKPFAATSLNVGVGASVTGWLKKARDTKPHGFCVRQANQIMESAVTKTGASHSWTCRI